MRAYVSAMKKQVKQMRGQPDCASPKGTNDVVPGGKQGSQEAQFDFLCGQMEVFSEHWSGGSSEFEPKLQ